MGLHSFTYCDAPGERMECGVFRKSYLLIPKEFGGGHVVEYCYKGYSNMGGYDVFEKLAEWNRSWVGKEISLDSLLIKPERNQYSSDLRGEVLYNRAYGSYKAERKMILDFSKGRSDSYMRNFYGDDYLRDIGILLFEKNEELKYPLKIALYSKSNFESVTDCSKGDPLQGCN